MKITKETIQKNLKYISLEDCDELEKLLFQNVDINKYIVENYNSLMKEWAKNYPMLDVCNGVITIGINRQSVSYTIGNQSYDEKTVFDIFIDR